MFLSCLAIIPRCVIRELTTTTTTTTTSKNNSFNDQNNSSARTSHFLFSTFLCRALHDNDVKPPNLTFYGGREHTTTKARSSFWTWIESLRIQLQKNVPFIWHIERVQIDAIKFERAQIHFFSDGLISLPSSSSLLKVPITSFLVTWILFFKEYLWSPDSCLHCMFAIPGTEKLIDLKITGQPLDYEQSPHLHQRATKERTRRVKGRSRSISREATRVKAEGDSEMRKKKNALS